MVPNIAAAIAGKEGGKAWKIAYPSQENDMIVGIGAYREHGINQQYIGSAVCLDKEGELHNFDACLKGNFEELRATLIKAILNFYGKFKHPSRLIIYYHKKLNREESDIIEDALRTCQVSCPVIVIHVTETDNEDLMAFDTSCTNVLMPVSGTYIHLRTRKGCHEYLLYNNERYGGFGEKCRFSDRSLSRFPSCQEDGTKGIDRTRRQGDCHLDLSDHSHQLEICFHAKYAYHHCVCSTGR